MLTDNRTIVIGLGKTGLSVARFLQREQQSFMLMDSGGNPPDRSFIETEFPNTPFITGRLDTALLKAADEIIVSPGISLQEPAIKEAAISGTSVIGDIELFARHHSACKTRQKTAPMIAAITGSNGKSTVATLVGQMARDAGIATAVGGNIGVPVLDLLTGKEEINLYVLELSSFHLERTYSLQAEVATVLNVSADHMNRYDSLESYALVKQGIYRNATWSVFNRQDKLTQSSCTTGANTLSFGLDNPGVNEFGLSIINGNKYLTYQDEQLMPVTELLLQASHHYANVLAALAMGSILGIPMDSMLSTASNFRGLKHRCEYVLTHQQVKYINDSKGTNVGATKAAIQGVGDECIEQGGKIVLIAGGDGKHADFSPLSPLFKKYLRALIVMGKDADRLIAVSDKTIPYEHVESIGNAVAAAQNHAVSGDVVMLSPACSSLDMFSRFEERGDQFVQAVYEVAA